MSKSEHPEPVIRNAVTGFFIAAIAMTIPFYAVSLDRVKLPDQGIQPKENGNQKTSSKRTPPTVDAGRRLRIPGERLRIWYLAL